MNTENSKAQSSFFTQNMTKRQFLTRSKFLWGALLIVGVVSLVWRLPHLLAKDEPVAVSPIRALPVETFQVKALTAYQTSHAYSGQIMARRSSDLGFERAGRLTRLDVDDGAQVQHGDALATLDTQELQTTQLDLNAQHAQATARLAEMRAGPRTETIAAAKADVQERRAEMSLAQSRRTRRLQLWTKGVVAREEFDAAEAELQTWRARLDASQRRLDELLAGTRREQIQAQEAIVAQLEARLATAAIDLEKSVLKAPFTGTISTRLADEGTVVAAGQAILRLVENSHLEVRVGLPPHVATTLTPGSTYPVQVGSARHSARVTAILPELDATTRTVTAVLTFPPQQPGLPQQGPTIVSGQTARLQLNETIPTPGFWLPTSALSKGERGLWSCLVVMPGSTDDTTSFRTESRALEVLHTASNQVFVRGVLQDGEQIVKSGTHRLVAGQPVTPLATQPPTKP